MRRDRFYPHGYVQLNALHNGSTHKTTQTHKWHLISSQNLFGIPADTLETAQIQAAGPEVQVLYPLCRPHALERFHLHSAQETPQHLRHLPHLLHLSLASCLSNHTVKYRASRKSYCMDMIMPRTAVACLITNSQSYLRHRQQTH